MKALVLLAALAGCMAPAADAEKFLGPASVCTRVNDYSAQCIRGGQLLFCVVRHGDVACAPISKPASPEKESE